MRTSENTPKCRVISFSITDDNIKAKEALTYLKNHSLETGKTFSSIVIQAIISLTNRIENDTNN